MVSVFLIVSCVLAACAHFTFAQDSSSTDTENGTATQPSGSITRTSTLFITPTSTLFITDSYSNHSSVNIQTNGSGSAYAFACASAYDEYDTSVDSVNSAIQTWTNGSYSLTTETTVYGTGSYSLALEGGNTTVYTLCDGIPRVNATVSTVYQTSITSYDTFSSQIFPPLWFTEPSCSINPSDCAVLQKSYTFGTTTGAPNCNASTVNSATLCKGPCHFEVNRARLFYWPVSLTYPGSTPCPSLGRTVLATPTADGPNTAIYSGTTFTSPTVYISFDTLVGNNFCVSQPTVANGLLEIPSSALSSFIQTPGVYTDIFGTAASDASVGSGMLDGSQAFNYADLAPNPVPWSVYSARNCGLAGLTGPNCTSTIYGEYNPILIIPSQVTSLNPLFSTCRYEPEYGYGGFFDPPYALIPQADAAITPSPGDPGSNNPAPATPGPSVEPAGPTPTVASAQPVFDPTTAAQPPDPAGPSQTAGNPPADPGSSPPAANPPANNPAPIPVPADPNSPAGNPSDPNSPAPNPAPAPPPSDPNAPSDPNSPAPNPAPAAPPSDPNSPAPNPAPAAPPSDPNSPAPNPAPASPPSDPNTPAPNPAPGSPPSDPNSPAGAPAANPPPPANSDPSDPGANGIGVGPVTIVPNGPAATVSNQVVSAGASNLVVEGSTIPLGAIFTPPPAAGSGAVVTIGGQTFTAAADPGSNGAIVIGSNSLSVSGPAATIGGQVVSLGPSGIVIGSSTISLSPLPAAATNPLAGSSGVLTIQGHTFSAVQPAGSSNEIVIGSATLSVSGPAATISGQVLSLGPSGLVIPGTSIPLSALPTNAPSSLVESAAVITIDGQTWTALETPGANQALLIDASTTETINLSSPLTINGSVISLNPTAGLVIGGSLTVPFTPTTVPASSGGIGAYIISGIGGGGAGANGTATGTAEGTGTGTPFVGAGTRSLSKGADWLSLVLGAGVVMFVNCMLDIV
ncbi:hypothetical protein MMC09_003503 [Bachmanniomyces sp. S44760]|nr:hypothetical protein [Bachmanniomyces sp. S44760]